MDRIIVKDKDGKVVDWFTYRVIATVRADGVLRPVARSVGVWIGEEMDLPESHNTPAFKAKWAEWIAYRKKRRLAKYATDRVIINLCRFAVTVAIAAIDYSMDNNYQGLFPEKFGAENVARDQRLGRDIQRGGRAKPPDGKYDNLDKGTPPPDGEEGTGDPRAA